MIHQYISNGYHIVMDVNSGSVHVMDKTAYDSVPIVERLLRQGTEARKLPARWQRSWLWRCPRRRRRWRRSCI